MIASTLSVVEAVWITGGALAFTIDVWAWRDAIGDRRATERAKRNGLLRMVTKASVAREAGRTARQLLLLAAGVVAAATPDPVREATGSSARRDIMVALFLAFQWAIVASAILDRLSRRRMIEYERRRTDAG